jgi:hypothetical protein
MGLFNVVDECGLAALTALGGVSRMFRFFAGGVYAFDPRSGFTIKPSVIGRVSFGIVASLGLSALWHWPFAGFGVAGMGGAVLGYFGMAWAKYVDDVSF